MKMVDSLDRRVAKILALLDSAKGREIYNRNKYQFGLGSKSNICGIIQEATGVHKRKILNAIYERVVAELAARKTERLAERTFVRAQPRRFPFPLRGCPGRGI